MENPPQNNRTAATPTRTARLWHTLMPSCDIIFHIHIPKTGGTSIAHVLMNTTIWMEVGKQSYVQHGRQHWWKTADALQRARQARSQVAVTAETGIDDLVAGGYPWFENTCFFSVLREPHEWLSSAYNHMQSNAKRKARQDGVNGTYGYFDRPNIQSNMVGLWGENTGVVMCVATVSSVKTLLAEFTDTQLPHHNAKPHAVNITPEVTEVVRQKYAQDVELWDLVRRRGVLCW